MVNFLSVSNISSTRGFISLWDAVLFDHAFEQSLWLRSEGKPDSEFPRPRAPGPYSSSSLSSGASVGLENSMRYPSGSVSGTTQRRFPTDGRFRI